MANAKQRTAVLSLLAGLAGIVLLAAAAATTGTLALVTGIVGGGMLGGAVVTPLVSRHADDLPESIGPPQGAVITDDEAQAVADVIQSVVANTATATAAATAAAVVAAKSSPAGQWIERTAARTATAKQRGFPGDRRTRHPLDAGVDTSRAGMPEATAGGSPPVPLQSRLRRAPP